MSISQRKHLRATVGPEFTVDFRFDGRAYAGVRVTNLGSRGCSLRLDSPTAPPFESGHCLEELVLVHPDLPPRPMSAQVVWRMGAHRDSAQGGIVLVGLRFLHPSPELQIRVHELVARHLGVQFIA